MLLEERPRDDAADIVTDREHHEEKKKGHPYSHRVLLEPHTERSTTKELKGKEHEVTTIQDRNRKKIHDAERYVEEDHHRYNGEPSLARARCGLLNDLDRTADGLLRIDETC